jgi:hypothetical protein
VTRVRKWLGYSFGFELTLGELLVIVLIVVLVKAIWPGIPAWAFFLIGAAVGAFGQAVRNFRRRSASA